VAIVVTHAPGKKCKAERTPDIPAVPFAVSATGNT
jgi:hypothetical protein